MRILRALLLIRQQIDLKKIEKWLQKNEFEVQMADTVEEAQSLAGNQSFDLAVLDYQMTDGESFSILKQLLDKNADIYPVMLFRQSEMETSVAAYRKGLRACILKPLKKYQLEAVLTTARQYLEMVTDNHMLVDQVQKDRQFYETLINTTDEAVFVVDLDFRVQFFNNASLSLLKVGEGQLKNSTLHEFIDDGYKVLSYIYQQLILGKPVSGYRVGIKHDNKKSFDALLTASILHKPNGKTEGLVINLSNTVIHNELFNRVLRKEKLSTIVKLANALGHEIRNPLNILFGRLQLLASEIDERYYKHAYGSIQRQIQRLLDITDLLGKFNFSKEDSIPEVFSLMEVIQEALFQKYGEFERKQIRLRINFDDQENLVEGNRLQFTDAFSYLLDTIVEFAPIGKEIELNGVVQHGHRAGKWLELQLQIPDVHLKNDELFDPYYSEEPTLNGLLGLGMTIMQTVFTNYGAKIESSIQNGDGTILRLRFPVLENTPLELDKRSQKRKNLNPDN